jgi:diacylglycerol kinase
MIRFKRLLKSFSYAGRGLAKVFREEQNFKIEVFAALLVVLAAILVGISFLEAAILALTVGLVLVMEVVNSAVEAISDSLKPRLDIYVKRIKDIVAAGVMIAAITAIVVGSLIFIPYFF